MRAGGIGGDVEGHERIGLGADHLRHLFQLDPIVAQPRVALHLSTQITPGGEETFGRNALRKVARQKRRVVVALLLAEPAQPLDAKLRRDGKRQDERGLAIRIGADDDDGPHAVRPSDVPVPGGEPIKALECGAVGDVFEAAPLAFDRVEIVMDDDAEIGREFTRQRGETRHGRMSGCRRRIRSPVRLYWCRACHGSLDGIGGPFKVIGENR